MMCLAEWTSRTTVVQTENKMEKSQDDRDGHPRNYSPVDSRDNEQNMKGNSVRKYAVGISPALLDGTQKPPYTERL